MNPLHGQESNSSSTNMTNPSAEDIQKAHQILYHEGLKLRYQVAGAEHVERSLKAADNAFAKPMQEYVCEAGWGWVWTRPGLELKVRSFLNIAMLCAQNRSHELAVHVRGALNNGATDDEIREVILQAATYCGMPAGLEGFRVAGQAIEDWQKEQKTHEKHHTHERHSDVGIEMRMENL